MNKLSLISTIALFASITLPAVAHVSSSLETSQHMATHMTESGLIGLCLLALITGLGLWAWKR